MKVVLLIPTLGAGGAERVFTLMANFWNQKGFDVTVISLDSPSNPPFFQLDPQIKYHPLNLLKEEKSLVGKAIRTIKQIWLTRAKVKMVNPDVVIAQLDIAIFLAITSTVLSKVKSMAYEGNNPYLNTTNKYLQQFNNFLYRFADRIILQTHQIARTFPQNLQKKISVIYNPITVPNAQLEENDYLRNFQNKTVISVGRLEHQKGYDILLEAFQIFLNKNPGWKLVILGEGQLRPELENMCKDLGISENVKMPGREKHPFERLKDCSIYVLSSRFEGLPNALLEAMSMGLPVISTRCRFGPEEIISHQENGLLIPVEDPMALADALRQLAQNVEFCQSIGTKAKDIMKVCSPEVVMQQWENEIKKLR